MKCKAARNLFSAAFDVELSVSEEREFRSHLEECRLCSNEFNLFVKSVELVTSLPRPSESPLFEQKLARALGADEALADRPLPRAPLLAPTPALAFATAVVLVGLLVMFPAGQSDWENLLVRNQLAVSELAMSELVATRLAASQPGDTELQSLGPSSLDDALVSSGNAGSLSGEELSLWSSDVSTTSSGQAGDAIALLGDVGSEAGAVLEIEFVLDPFLFEGAEVRRVDTSPASGTEVEYVSMTF